MPRAPRRCPGQNGTCTELITNTKYCARHTVAWAGERTSSSTITSTAAWKQFRDYILDRDGHHCHLRYPAICTGRATTIDKIIPASQRPDLALDPANAHPACKACNEHKARTTDRQPPPSRRR
ncbi:HNH endonuclease [Mycobacterium heckeshornense]|uniref:HNH endonuclease n=1 Tax=Mycobacterium heckeshornense TaxID=110505 RepID=UPI000662027F|nr:HNH endonuclease [Mycobacterium heckeshornense]KMV23347.1 hypothetical protein ACT16_06670 [Mycobacterium heckeshornense]